MVLSHHRATESLPCVLQSRKNTSDLTHGPGSTTSTVISIQRPPLHAPHITEMPSNHTSSFPSTPSLASINTTTSTSSTTPLLPTSSSSQPVLKDYAKSFGMLQSQYGWGPVTYAPTSALSSGGERKEKKRKGHTTLSTNVLEEREGERQSGGKNYESAFGSLSSRYGFGGSWSTPVKKSKKRYS